MLFSDITAFRVSLSPLGGISSKAIFPKIKFSKRVLSSTGKDDFSILENTSLAIVTEYPASFNALSLSGP